MAKEKYDLVVLGGGIAGYSAAIRAHQLGKTVALVEQDKLGGTCLHKGCIPTKSFLKTSEIYRYIKNAKTFGIRTGEAHVHFPDVIKRKDHTIQSIYSGLEALIKSKQIDVYNGIGRLLGSSIFSPQNGTVSVEYENGESDLLPNDYVLIATGSRPTELPFLPFDHQLILNSDDMMHMESLPKSITIIGGGVIGVEFASFLNEMGVEVHIIEASKRLLINESPQISQALEKSFEKDGIHIHTQVSLEDENIEIEHDKVNFNIENSKFSTEKVLVAVGRKANVENIRLNNTKVKLNQRQTIETSPFMETNESHIYAAGDVIGYLQLAHVGAKEGVIAVEHMFNQNPLPIDYNQMPKCVYSYPEIASVGMDEATAQSQNIKVKKVKTFFKANGKSLIETISNQDGFAELLFDSETDTFIGGSLIGPHVTELINELSMLYFMNGSSIELGQTTHAHPSISELLMELGLKNHNESIHI
ncbi:dihydrolipoyl dehydrogenase [Staphylococcus felis]|uniref:dihydrolipoyl dehydrogenase n=1 Tax=Staphylococcus felis TaxID=46127 RepID=UPI000E26C809|nr:dihydrolipoyl dehydrogenase [Staphylococcus felis]REI28315.1 dihydrolipoyl dehydrogenase [Staphylococcus felis]